MILHCWETTAFWQVVRWLVPADDVLAQTILHAPLAAFTSVPGPHGLQVAGGGGEGDGGGGLGDGWPLGSRVIAKPAMAAPVMKLVPMSPVTWLGVGG